MHAWMDGFNKPVDQGLATRHYCFAVAHVALPRGSAETAWIFIRTNARSPIVVATHVSM